MEFSFFLNLSGMNVKHVFIFILRPLPVLSLISSGIRMKK